MYIHIGKKKKKKRRQLPPARDYDEIRTPVICFTVRNSTQS